MLYTDTPKSARIVNNMKVMKNDHNNVKKKRRHGHGNQTGKHRQRHMREHLLEQGDQNIV